MKHAILIGLAGGVLIAVLKVLEYKHLVLGLPGSAYGGFVAALFSGLGLWMGMRWARSKEIVVGKEIPGEISGPPTGPAEPFAVDTEQLRRLGLTPREQEVLTLVAEGLSNREIAGRLFVSENTVKTHCSRLFEKLDVNRRVQALRRGRELRLIP